MSSIIHQTGSVRPLSLQEREQPQLYRELFSLHQHLSHDFDEVLLAPRPAEQMRITDTTFRDGQQARPPYTVKQVAKMFDFLHRMGGKTGLITRRSSSCTRLRTASASTSAGRAATASRA